MITLLPFSLEEIPQKLKIKTPEEIMYKGGYPRLHMNNIVPDKFYNSYITTYLERDVRTIANIKDFDAFRKFLVVLE